LSSDQVLPGSRQPPALQKQKASEYCHPQSYDLQLQLKYQLALCAMYCCIQQIERTILEPMGMLEPVAKRQN
jgi:hypothetical protein